MFVYTLGLRPGGLPHALASRMPDILFKCCFTCNASLYDDIGKSGLVRSIVRAIVALTFKSVNKVKQAT